MDRRAFLLSAVSTLAPTLCRGQAGAAAAPMRILAVGDSVGWGQGLLDSQKMHTLVAQTVAERTGVRPLMRLYACSGATIGFKDGKATPSARIDSWWPREVPEGNPTLYEQCLQVAADHPDDRYDLVLVLGGINDINVRTIFNPLTSTDEIAALSHNACHHAMGLLLDHIRQNLVSPDPAARVLVLGYYRLFSPASAFPDIVEVIRVLVDETFNPPAVAPRQAAPFESAAATLEGILERNAEAFRDASQADLSAAVRDANAKGSGKTFAFVDPAFADDAAAFAPPQTTLLWGLDPKTETAVDPRAADRARYCAQVGQPPGFSRFTCDRASLGHPNIAGAQRYAQKILATLGV